MSQCKAVVETLFWPVQEPASDLCRILYPFIHLLSQRSLSLNSLTSAYYYLLHRCAPYFHLDADRLIAVCLRCWFAFIFSNQSKSTE